MRQKLFTKQIDDMLFKQYAMGNDLSKQKVVAKIFNPYGRGVWYLLNSDPQDPDYLWAIVDLFEPEVGSVSREDLETIKVPPFGLNLERDIYFQPINAQELLNRVMQGERFADGGATDLQIVKSDTQENYLTTQDALPSQYAVKLANGGNTDADIYYGVVDANNNLVFQSKNEKEAKMISNSYQGSIVKSYKGKGKIHEYADGGMMDKSDLEGLIGLNFQLDLDGGGESSEHKIVDVRVTPPNFRYRDVTLITKEGSEDKIPMDKIQTFLNNDPIVIKDSQNEPYSITLIDLFEPRVVRTQFEEEEFEFGNGGEVNKYSKIFDSLKKGDKIKMSYSSSIKNSNEKELVVLSKNVVGKGKSYESEKITFKNLENPDGVKYYAYKRKSGFVSFAMGDLAISNVEISTEEKMANGGSIPNNYRGRTPEDIWNNLSKEQRSHFIYDHAEEIEEYRGEEYGDLSSKEIIKAYNSDYKDLDKHIKNRFDNHVREGQYADGGLTDIGGTEFSQEDLSGMFADGGKLRNGKYRYQKGDEGMYEGDEVRVKRYLISSESYDIDLINEDGKVISNKVVKANKFEKQFAYFPKMADGGMFADGGILKQGDEVMFQGNKYIISKITNQNVAGFIDTKWYLDSSKMGVRGLVLDSPKGITKISNDDKMAKGGVIPNEINELYKFLKETYPNTRITINKGKLGNDFMIKVYDDGFFTGYVSELEDKFPTLKIKRVVKKYSKEGHKTDSIIVRSQNMMAKGGVTFKDKVKSIKASLLNRKKVSPSVQKDYGKTYSKKEALESAKRIAGAMRKKETLKKK